uniref:uncharacterized protein LOC122593998 n=1 Tax=Erigeron canadensis TaxID=72917 RepID=UPI001CB9551C|nr:uncharacterized protein LOC122593998 [Erigeron canadensis]
MCIQAGGNKFEVRNNRYAYSVDMDMGTCDCRLWELSGIPCVHAMQAIYKMNKDPEEFVAIWFRKVQFDLAYQFYLNPVGGMDTWISFPNAIVPLPQRPRTMPGRPKKKRQRAAHEPRVCGSRVKHGVEMKCLNCLQKGHNVKTCNQKKTIPVVKKPKGRPPKRKLEQSQAVSSGAQASQRPSEVVMANAQSSQRPPISVQSQGPTVSAKSQGPTVSAKSHVPSNDAFKEPVRFSPLNSQGSSVKKRLFEDSQPSNVQTIDPKSKGKATMEFPTQLSPGKRFGVTKERFRFPTHESLDMDVGDKRQPKPMPKPTIGKGKGSLGMPKGGHRVAFGRTLSWLSCGMGSSGTMVSNKPRHVEPEERVSWSAIRKKMEPKGALSTPVRIEEPAGQLGTQESVNAKSNKKTTPKKPSLPLKRRIPSQRILGKKLAKRLESGLGLTPDQPITLEL